MAYDPYYKPYYGGGFEKRPPPNLGLQAYLGDPNSPLFNSPQFTPRTGGDLRGVQSFGSIEQPEVQNVQTVGEQIDTNVKNMAAAKELHDFATDPEGILQNPSQIPERMEKFGSSAMDFGRGLYDNIRDAGKRTEQLFTGDPVVWDTDRLVARGEQMIDPSVSHDLFSDKILETPFGNTAMEMSNPSLMSGAGTLMGGGGGSIWDVAGNISQQSANALNPGLMGQGQAGMQWAKETPVLEMMRSNIGSGPNSAMAQIQQAHAIPPGTPQINANALAEAEQIAEATELAKSGGDFGKVMPYIGMALSGADMMDQGVTVSNAMNMATAIAFANAWNPVGWTMMAVNTAGNLFDWW